MSILEKEYLNSLEDIHMMNGILFQKRNLNFIREDIPMLNHFLGN